MAIVSNMGSDPNWANASRSGNASICDRRLRAQEDVSQPASALAAFVKETSHDARPVSVAASTAP